VTDDTVLTVGAIVVVFIWLPVLVLTLIDLTKTLQYKTSNHALGRLAQILLATPSAALGILSVTFGAAIVGWVIYNVFFERQSEYTGPDFVFSLASFGMGPTLIGVGIYWVTTAFKKEES